MKRALAILFLANSLFAAPRTFDVTGQVLGINRSAQRWILLDGSVKPNNFSISDRTLSDFRSGDIIRACGVTQTNKHGEAYSFATNIVRVGKRPLPETVEIDGGRINDPDMPHRCVRIRGIVSAVKRDDTNMAWNQITLRTPTGKICAVVQDDAQPIAGLASLVDAEVTLSGYVTRFGSMLRFLGNELMLFDEGCVTVNRKAPDDPFAAPPYASSRVRHRQRIEGVVVAVDRHRIYLDSGRVDFLPVLSEMDAPPPVGARVTAVGYAEPDLFGQQLADARVRVERGTPAAKPDAKVPSIDAEALFTDAHGNAVANSKYYGKPIRLQGKVVNTSDNIRHTHELQLACGRRVVAVDVSRIGDLRDPESLAGCEVSVAGYCLPRFERDAASSWIPRFEGFSLVPRTGADIEVRARPSWWTPAKLLCVIGALLVLIAAILVWNQTLRVMSERRGARLARERIEHAKSELKVEERTRLAVELHDSIVQNLAGVIMELETAKRMIVSTNEEPLVHLKRAERAMRSCHADLRNCLWDLRSEALEDEDMSQAIRTTLLPHLRDATIDVRFNVPRAAVSDSTAYAILRIIRELTLNAIKHGGAKHVKIAGAEEGSVLRFSVRDDGAGFDPDAAPGVTEGHFGLEGIRQRVRSFSGTFDMERTAEGGMRAIVTIPIPSASEGTK